MLSVANESELLALLDKAQARGLRATGFHEPDLDGQLTAICIEPCEATSKLVSNLPLLLREPKPVHSSSGKAALSKSENTGSNPVWASDSNP